jgi:alanine racemase
MSTAKLTIDLTAIRANWRALNAKSAAETAAVVKANGYGLEATRVVTALAKEGARQFFVAVAEEAPAVREAVGQEAKIYVFSGHMQGDTDLIRDNNLIPMINSVDQLLRHVELLPGQPFGIQLDTGMNRLGMEPFEWQAVRELALRLKPRLVMSHLACADEPDHYMNAKQLQIFKDLTSNLTIPKSLSATGGILLGADFHFNLTRPGIGLYGGLPFRDSQSVVTLEIPVIQTRDVETGESVGYGNTWIAPSPRKIATVSAGYADGIVRAMGPVTALYAGTTVCPVVGRISMDMIGVDVSDVETPTQSLQFINETHGIDKLAKDAGTIGYEILTSLGSRYQRRYI